MITKYPTVFCDIDGTIFKYRKFETYQSSRVEVLQGAHEALNEWYDKGAQIILTTARPENLRQHTVQELEGANIPYHQLLMGIGRGTRYLINDKEDPFVDRAIAISIDRNQGLNKKDVII